MFFPESHTAFNACEHLTTVLNEYGLSVDDRRIQGLTTDNASNMKALRRRVENWKWTVCAAHLIYLLLGDANVRLKPSVEAARNLIKNIRNDGRLDLAFHKAQGQEQEELILAVAT